MKRPLLWIVALVIAAAPVLADVCRLDCERQRQPECPLHQTAPHKCSHDHTIGAATLTRSAADAPRSVDVAIAAAPHRMSGLQASIDLILLEHEHPFPIRSPHIDVLRI